MVRTALADGPAGVASWHYDAVDLASGTVHTTPLKRLEQGIYDYVFHSVVLHRSATAAHP
jgi:hypothetical protein